MSGKEAEHVQSLEKLFSVSMWVQQRKLMLKSPLHLFKHRADFGTVTKVMFSRFSGVTQQAYQHISTAETSTKRRWLQYRPCRVSPGKITSVLYSSSAVYVNILKLKQRVSTLKSLFGFPEWC